MLRLEKRGYKSDLTSLGLRSKTEKYRPHRITQQLYNDIIIPWSLDLIIYNYHSTSWGAYCIAAELNTQHYNLCPTRYPLLLGGEKQCEVKCLAQGLNTTAIPGLEPTIL